MKDPIELGLAQDPLSLGPNIKLKTIGSWRKTQEIGSDTRPIALGFEHKIHYHWVLDSGELGPAIIGS